MWSVPRDQRPRPADYHIVQYRTVGQWVPLSNRIPAGQASYNWTTASRGALYHFRVVGYYDPGGTGGGVAGADQLGSQTDDNGASGSDEDESLLESLPSAIVVINTGGLYGEPSVQ